MTNARLFLCRIYPAEDQVFAALQLTPFDKVHVLLLGQDPYPGEGMAHGLCFSVSPTVRKASRVAQEHLQGTRKRPGVPVPNNGCLDAMGQPRRPDAQHDSDACAPANRFRTRAEAGKPSPTRSSGKSARGSDPVVFVLWGKPAQAKIKLIDTSRHTIVQSAHPSPLSAKAFLGSRPFSRINSALAGSKETTKSTGEFQIFKESWKTA